MNLPHSSSSNPAVKTQDKTGYVDLSAAKEVGQRETCADHFLSRVLPSRLSSYP